MFEVGENNVSMMKALGLVKGQNIRILIKSEPCCVFVTNNSTAYDFIGINCRTPKFRGLQFGKNASLRTVYFRCLLKGRWRELKFQF